MRPCRRLLLVAALVGLTGCNGEDGPADHTPGWSLKPPAPGAVAVNAGRMLPGLYPAGSRAKDHDALGGFGPCDNDPHDLGGKEWGANGAVSVVAFPDEPVAYFQHRGFALRVVNRTGEPVPFAACDSMLMLVREARDTAGAWRAIESHPPAICGNSYHRVFLGPGQYWEFPAREYAGPLKTTMRFRLDPGSGRPAVYSDESDGRVAPGQLVGR